MNFSASPFPPYLRSTIVVLVSFCLVPTGTAQREVKNASARSSITDQRIRFFQAQLQRDPDYYVNYNRLASAYMQKARETGDLTYYQLAEEGLKKSLELESEHPQAATAFAQSGAVQFAEHRFSDAAASAERALKLQLDDPAAQALLGDAQLEMGEYSKASAAFGKLVAPRDGRTRHGSEYLRSTREASLAWIQGDVEQALALMTQACTLAQQMHLPGENVAWTHFMLGEQMFQTGNFGGAESEMRSALRVYPAYYRALGGMAQVRAAQHRYGEAVEFYQKAVSIIPLPLYVAALGDIYRRQKKETEAERQYALVEYIGKLGALNRQVYNRELAVFYADHDRHVPESLSLAQKELEARQDVYSWDALAWSLLKNGRAPEAHDAMRKALALGTRDGLLFFHAAAIERELGQRRASAEHARKAIATNPEFHVLYADEARRWAAEGHSRSGSVSGDAETLKASSKLHVQD